MAEAVHLDLDGAWGALPGIESRDLRGWGPRLRYCAPDAEVGAFDRAVGDLPPYILYGSGDFHYLAALWVRRAAARVGGAERPFTLVSFDNHPDWDIRPPRWACGGWICRALETPGVGSAHVWGCGNFELRLPSRLFAHRSALRQGRLTIHPWSERQPMRVQRRFACIRRDDWRGAFERFADGLRGEQVYVTVDLDCLNGDEAATNWENGLFSADDVAWAVARLRDAAEFAGADLCGAWSEPHYARRRQRFAGWWDHPGAPEPGLSVARSVNEQALAKIWPVLTGQ